MNNGTITYRYLKGNPVSYQIPISSMMLPKEVEVDGSKRMIQKKVAYYEGSSSIFVEDNAKSDLPKKNIWLTDQGNGFTEMYVDEDNYILNTILQKNPKFGTEFGIYDEDTQAKKNLEDFDMKERALGALQGIHGMEAKARAYAIFGAHAFAWTETRAISELKSKAFNEPRTVIDAMNEKDYQARIIAGQAYNMGIIESNNTETFVIWTDSGESIIGIPNGQLGIDKLAEFLSFQTDDSLSVIQRIGSVIDRKNGKLLPSEELLSAQAEYKIKFGKDVAPVMKNNLVWIQKELAK